MLQKIGLLFLSLLAFVAILFVLATGKITVPARQVSASQQSAPVAAKPVSAPVPVAQPAAAQPVSAQSAPAAPAQPAGAPTQIVAPYVPQYVPASGDVGPKPDQHNSGMCYRVKPGDTLYRIAAKYGTSVAALQRANNLRGTLIYAGQTLCIPTFDGYPGGHGDSEGGKNNGYPDQPVTYGPWYAEYYNNNGFQGTPGFVRYDSAINFDWGYSTPNDKVIQADNFSVRWTSNRWMQTGVYTFHLKYNDGLRLLVNETEVFNDLGNPSGEREVGFAIPIDRNQVVIKVEYVERTDKAMVNVRFARISSSLVAPVPPWKVEFFNSIDLTGPVIWSENRQKVDYNWGNGSPKPGLVSIDFFSARLTRQEYMPAGKYVWIARVQDGVRVLLDGQNIMDQWRQQPLTTFISNPIDVAPGYHSITIEYQHYQDNATLEVYREKR